MTRIATFFSLKRYMNWVKESGFPALNWVNDMDGVEVIKINEHTYIPKDGRLYSIADSWVEHRVVIDEWVNES